MQRLRRVKFTYGLDYITGLESLIENISETKIYIALNFAFNGSDMGAIFQAGPWFRSVKATTYE